MAPSIEKVACHGIPTATNWLLFIPTRVQLAMASFLTDPVDVSELSWATMTRFSTRSIFGRFLEAKTTFLLSSALTLRVWN